MPDNDLAAALEFVKRRSAFVPTADNSTVVSKDEVAALRTIRDAYLAREADDAKPVTSDWLVSVLGEPSRNGVWYHALASDPQRKHEIEIMLRGDICGDLLCAESPQSATVSLTTRKKLRAFLELADWPTNETNGGE